MSTHNAEEAKAIVRRYLKLDKWFEEDIGMIEKAIDLIVQAAADRARHDIGKAQPTQDLLQRCAQINPYGDAHNAAIDNIVAGRMAKGDHVHVMSMKTGALCMLPEDRRCKFDGTDPGSDPVKDRVKVL